MKITFIHFFKVANALRSRQSDLALQPGIMAANIYGVKNDFLSV